MTEQQIVRSDVPDSPASPDEVWRDEVQARVARYRTRRGRRVEGTFSMRFPFGAADEEKSKAAQASATSIAELEPAISSTETRWTEESLDEVVEPILDLPAAAIAESVAVVAEDEEEVAAAVEVQSEASIAAAPPDAGIYQPEPEASSAVESSDLVLEADPILPPVPRPHAKRKIIAFPRQATTQEETYRLADPVVPEQPRILDVPEELEPFPTTPLLEGLQLPAAQRSAAPSRDHIDLPLQAVGLARRFCAGLVDCAVVIASAAVFGAIAYKLMPKLTPSKPLLLTAAVLPVLLWAAYQYILVMYAGATAGMNAAKIRLVTFKGTAPNWRHRRTWVIGLYFSAASLGMGLLWSLVDVDTLCWHDRISHTYLTRRE